ncbi:unnamed protein product [Didymodactylos carnosus]|uniref:Uncharacterized protein n=1 Tax=Didymodactylos carnosus TaxID=1234261 RepID=A0A8S2RMX3_9BILA|nr:unnamed protein product [Didymodactylos carnosus]CAF4178292.1 unnamed protein product [Didymodactylos carnosus]
MTLVVGAASGIGRISAIELAKLGAKVIVGIRGQERAEKIAEEIRREANVSTGRVVGYNLDLSDLSSVQAFANQIIQREQYLNVLLNNAGITRNAHSFTTDGFEIQFGTNHIGHFYLTKLLLPLLIKSKARIVNVSSTAYCFVNDEGIDYKFPSSSCRGMRAYSQSKLAQIWHASELQDRYGHQGITAYSLHPGTIMTEIFREASKIALLFAKVFCYLVAKTPYQGALTSLYCCLSNDVKPGQFYADCQPVQGSPLLVNKKLAEECWNFSEEQIKERIGSIEE